MAEKIIDIYEKYGNLFRLKITPKIEKLHELPFQKFSKLPVVHRQSRDKGFSLMKVAGSREIPAEPWAVKDVMRSLVCSQVEKTPGLHLDQFKTKIIDQKTALKAMVIRLRLCILHVDSGLCMLAERFTSASTML